MERNRLSTLIHVFLILAAATTCFEMHSAQPWTIIPYGLILIGCIFRFLVYRKLQPLENFEFPLSLRLLHKACLFVMGSGWSLFWYDAHNFYTIYSVQGMFSLLTLAALVSGAVSSNAPRPAGYICLALPMVVVPAIYFLKGGNQETIFGYSILLFGIFNMYQLKVSYNNVRSYVEKDLTITLERDKLQTLFDAVPGFVCIIDNNLRYVSMNLAAQNQFKLHNYLYQHISVQNPDSEFVRFVTNFMNENKVTAVSEVRHELNPGHSYTILSIQRLKGPAGGAIIVAIPIDELVKTREKIKDQEAKAFYTSKLVSLGEMAAGIAHEINNPLAIILGSADQIMRELKHKEPRFDRMELLTEKIQKTVGRISIIIKSLRSLARNGEKDPFVPIKIETIIEPSLEISRQRFRDNDVELRVEMPSQEILCLGQEVQLSQVMMNLLNNAFDAALEGPTPRWVKLNVSVTAGFVDVTIQDSGKGIPKENRTKIMDPFFTTKAINKGTGLGLSISKSIMEQHGGSLTLDENASHTTFVMRIPTVTASNA